MPRKSTKSDYDLLRKVARDHIRRANVIGKSIDHRMKTMAAAHDGFTLNDEIRKDFASVTQAVQHAGKAIQQADEADEKLNAGLTEAQLEAQFKFELIRAAQTMTDEDWMKMVEARRKAGKIA